MWSLLCNREDLSLDPCHGFYTQHWVRSMKSGELLGAIG